VSPDAVSGLESGHATHREVFGVHGEGLPRYVSRCVMGGLILYNTTSFQPIRNSTSWLVDWLAGLGSFTFNFWFFGFFGYDL
jgi:hypothetical protein